jgi:hypothetical protein
VELAMLIFQKMMKSMRRKNANLIYCLDSNRTFLFRVRHIARLFVTRLQSKFSLLDEIERDIDFILHIGAHLGQERHLYSRFNVPVFWVEALPNIFVELQKNIKIWPNQYAICGLIDGEKKNLVSCEFKQRSLFFYINPKEA